MYQSNIKTKNINKYSEKLINEVDKKYNTTNLKRMRQFYLMIEKGVLIGAPIELESL